MMDWFTRDWKLKLISFFLAVGLWYYAVGEEGIEVTRTVPLEIKIQNAQMSILKTSAKNVHVTLFAPRALLSDLTSEKIMAVHEIGGDVKNAGDYSFRVEPQEIKLPTPQIRVVKIEPEVVAVTVDELMVQKLKVIPNFSGEPAFGYKVTEEDIQLNPNAILIEGPKGALEKMESVKTEKIDLVGRVRSFRRTVSLDLPGNLKPLSEALIDIYIPIREEFSEKILENFPIKVLRAGTENQKVEIQPAAATFTLKGAKTQIDQLTSQAVIAYVDLAGLPSGEHLVDLKMTLPEGVSLKQDVPLKIKAIIKK